MTEKANVLFVDDELQVLATLRALFCSQYQVFIAKGGKEALDIIRREPIHVIVSDQLMPKMLGHELLHQVKEIRPSAVRLLLTGYSDLSAIIHSINESEVFRFINKPWDNTKIRLTIENAVNIALDSADTIPALVEVAQDDDGRVDDASPQSQLPGILVMDTAPETLAQVQNLCQHNAVIHHAQNIDDALELLDEKEIGVIIADIMLEGEETADFIKLLKQQYPLIMTIVIAEAFDSENAISLINEARIFRFLPKPASDYLLGSSIHYGLRFYEANKENPPELQQLSVEVLKVVRNPLLSQKTTGRFKSLRARLGWGRS